MSDPGSVIAGFAPGGIVLRARPVGSPAPGATVDGASPVAAAAGVGPFEQQLTSLRPYVSPDWLWAANVGYYVHRGTVYLVGEFGQNPGGGSPLILTGLPSSLCPTHDTSVRVMYDWTNGSLPLSTAPFGTFPATMHTDGRLSFDEDPPAQYPGDYLWFNVGMVSWPTSQVTDDTFDWLDLSPHVNQPYYAPGTAKYALHDSRLHLSGALVNVSDPTGGHAALAFPPTWSPPIITDYIANNDIGSQATQFPDNAGDMLVIGENADFLFVVHNGFMAGGSLIDLTDVGWPLAYNPGPPTSSAAWPGPGSVTAEARPGGIVPR